MKVYTNRGQKVYTKIMRRINKKMAIGMVVIGMAAFVLGMVVAPRKSGAPIKAGNVNTDVVRIVAARDTANPLYAITMEYPQFDEASDAFNGEISAWANGSMDDFKKNAADNWKAEQDTAPAGQPKETYPASPFTFAITWESKQINTRAISIIVRLDSFEGGAHGRQELKTFNYDVVHGRDISLADLFPGNASYLGMVARYAHDRLMEDLASSNDGGDALANMISDGTAPTEENFTNFMFNDDVIDIYFPKYQVAPGVYGEQHVLMPRKGI